MSGCGSRMHWGIAISGPIHRRARRRWGSTWPPDTEHFDYHLIWVPTTVIVPDDRQIVRMRLVLDLACGDGTSDGLALAYDLFPVTRFEHTTHDLGNATLDVSKALRFAVPALAALGAVPGVAAAAAADCLGLKLQLPLRWTTEHADIQSSNRLLSTVDWYVRDSAIAVGFDGYAIIQVPVRSSMVVTGRMTIELRRTNPFGRVLKARFESDYRRYAIDAAARAAAGS